MRRYLSLMESDFPTELGNTYRSLENSSNPYSMNQGDRGDWAAGLDDVPIVDPSDPFDHEYLYWVGCAGSFDDRNKKTSRSVVKLLQRAGIDFGILGPSELCTGDPARRSGQRVPLPDAGHAERRGPQRDGRTQDHHAVPALLQHAEERVPAARRQLRGRAPLPADQRARRRRPALAGGRDARGARHLPRLVLPRAPQRRVPRTPQRHRLARRHRGRRDAAQRHPRACAAAPAARACGWRSAPARR